jgi:hypothetical protein
VRKEGSRASYFVGDECLKGLAGARVEDEIRGMNMAAEIDSRVEVLRNLREKKRGDDGALAGALEEISKALSNAYGLAAQSAKAARTSDDEAAIWKEISDGCNSALVEMKKVKDVLPITAAAYDKVLDLKLAAEERKNWVLEEKACQNKMPKGLFPEKS